MRLFTFWEQLLQDVRYAVRMMVARPLFSAVAALSLALGIGANVAIYSFIDAILLRALPVADPESLVALKWHSKAQPAVARSLNGDIVRDPRTGFTADGFPYATCELLRDSKIFSSVFAFTAAGRRNLVIGDAGGLASGQYVSGEFFSGLGIPPAAGRVISPSDDRAGAPPIMVLDYQYAERRFGDISRAVGQSVRVEDVLFTVVGVTPAEFFGADPSVRSDFYVPLHAEPLMDPLSLTGLDPNRRFTEETFYWVRLWGRLQRGVTLEQAHAALTPVFRRFVEASAITDKERTDLPALLLQEGAGGLDSLRRQYAKPLYVLMTMVGLILAIACANIANLLLARATGRQREIALRLSLGADRGRLARQLLTESALLSSVGGALGLGFAVWGIRGLTALIGNGRENFTLHATLNWHVFAIGLALSLVTGILFGLAPALRSTRVDLNHLLRQARAGGPPQRLFARLRVTPNQVLVVSQIAVSLLLLMTASLFVRTLVNLNAVNLGFNSERVLLFTLNARQAGYRDFAIVQFYEEVRARLSTIPGVRGVSTSNVALISGSESSTSIKIAGYTGNNRQVSFLYVGPGFLSNMQIPILLGREIDQRDLYRGSGVAVVNQEFARTYFTNENPVGRHFSMGMIGAVPDLEVVGVSQDARYNSLKQDIAPTVYLSYSTNLITLRGGMVFEVRAAGDPNAIAHAVRTALRQQDANVPISDISTQAQRIDQSMSQERTFATLCTCFALLAVLIACIGLYGTMAYTVARRTSEIGIRVALGAQRRSVVSMVLGEALAMAAVGLGIGIPATLVAARVLETFLFRIKPNDPMALAAAVAILLAAVLAAGYGPAFRASRVDPWTALREE